PVDHPVPDRARFVVTLLPRYQQLPAQLLPEALDGPVLDALHRSIERSHRHTRHGPPLFRLGLHLASRTTCYTSATMTDRRVQQRQADDVRKRLARAIPTPVVELDHANAWQLLMATILSAQSTDKKINEVTPLLFA